MDVVSYITFLESFDNVISDIIGLSEIPHKTQIAAFLIYEIRTSPSLQILLFTFVLPFNFMERHKTNT